LLLLQSILISPPPPFSRDLLLNSYAILPYTQMTGRELYC
jgi:hypothetical protein